ncbi:MAG: 5-deoxy-glucuronate isomerase, partial [Lachnospira sp.]|nr:5-deoxy-glucuronate isomerase [Lachnospira sp.]
MEVRQGANARDVKGYDTERLRNDFLIQNLFPADDFKLVYSQIDRIIVGGCMPVNKELTLEAGSELKAAYFLERREMGIFNVGGNGSVIVDGTEYKFKYRDGLYIGMGSKEIKFKSEDSSKPAKFYFNSTPAHKTYPTVFIDPAKDILPENKKELGCLESANHRTINKYILPGQVESCQLEMGMTCL